MNQNTRNQGTTTRMYLLLLRGGVTQSSGILAIARRVAAKIKPGVVTSPQCAFQARFRRQASPVLILSGNAGRNYC